MLHEAEKICDSICLIEGGQVILDGTLAEVRAAFPLRSLRVAWADETEPPAGLDGVRHVEKHEGSWRLTIDEGTDPSALLPQLAAAGRLTFFSADGPASARSSWRRWPGSAAEVAA